MAFNLMDALGVGDLLSNLTGSIGNIVFNAMDYNQAEKWNQKNYEMQLDNLQHQRWLQQHLFNREDDAVQRRAADLEAAGLSKTLAAGSAANAGSIVTSTAAQRGYTPRDSSGFRQLQNIEMVNALKGGIANVNKLEADAERAKADAERAALLNEETKHNLSIAQSAGVMTHDSSQIAEIAKLLAGIFDFDVADFGKNAMDAFGEIINTIASPLKEVADIASGNSRRSDSSPAVQALLDAANIINTSDNDVILYSNQKNSTVPSGTRRHSYAGGYSGGHNYKAVYVK